MGYKFLKKSIKVNNAIDLILKHLTIKLGIEKIQFDESLGRVLAEDIISKVDIPPVNKSAFDGYAVKGIDLISASRYSPLRLKVIDEVKIGEMPPKWTKGALKIATGAALPDGLDTVIPAEYVNILGDNEIEILKSFPIGDNVIQIGEDVKKGKCVLKAGRIINPFDLGMLAQLKKMNVKVLEKLRIVILPTGSELVEPNEEGDLYKTVDTNMYTLSALCKKPWIEVDHIKPVQDDLKALTQAIRSSMVNNHVLIITGGTSVGELDLVPEAVQRVGSVKLLIRGIGIQPGRPTGVAIVDSKLFFMLSGFPTACIIGYIALVRPLLYKIINTPEPPKPIVTAKLQSKVTSSLGVEGYVRVIVKKVGEKLIAEPVRVIGSSSISSLIEANGFLIVPYGSEGFDSGSEVQINLYDSIQD